MVRGMSALNRRLLVVAAGLGVAIGALAAGPHPRASAAGFGDLYPTGAIQHVVVIVQENRSFENMFHAFPGADTVSFGLNHRGKRVRLHQLPLTSPYDLDHNHSGFVTEFDNGKMDGFDLVFNGCRVNGCNPATAAYAYVNPADIAPYWSMASQYVLADHVLQTNEGSSYPSHQYLIAAQSGRPIAQAENGSHSGCAAPPGSTIPAIDLHQPYPGNENRAVFPCFDYDTVFDLVNAHGLTWKYYENGFGFWMAVPSIKHLYDDPLQMANLINPETQILTDIPAGKLASLTYVIPGAGMSDHPGDRIGGGPSWVASVVNAVGQSPFWKSTAIVITWDDWGGWFDHYTPRHPAALPQDPYEYGFRVPLLVISPYARQHYISHTDRDYSAILNMAGHALHVGTLQAGMNIYSDDLYDCFDFTLPPRPFTPFSTMGVPDWHLALKYARSPVDDDRTFPAARPARRAH
jgi:phospholipase C